MKYSIELLTSSKEYYFDENLNQREIIEAIELYLSFMNTSNVAECSKGGRVRVWHGMRFVCEYNTVKGNS